MDPLVASSSQSPLLHTPKESHFQLESIVRQQLQENSLVAWDKPLPPCGQQP